MRDTSVREGEKTSRCRRPRRTRSRKSTPML
jgi:hypothetical protein